MQKTNTSLKFIMDIAKFQTELSRRLDTRLNGISLNEFIILSYLDRAEGNVLRRIDLAEKVGLTASGITRLLLPMEKIGLIKESVENDARVSLVKTASGGKTKLEEAYERIETYLEELIPEELNGKLQEFSNVILRLEKNV